MINQEGSKKIELEALLRLKRIEQPAAEFWPAFESKLRVKQLAAIVRSEPWWRKNYRAILGNARFYIPAGFAALVIVTLIGVRERPQASYASAVRSVAILSKSVPTSPVAVLGLVVPASQPQTTSSSIPSPVTASLGLEAPARVDVSALTTAGEEMPVFTMSARAENVFAATDAEAIEVRSTDSAEPSKVLVGASSAEPLLRMESPADRRRGRLLASSLPSGGVSPVLATDRLTSRLSDDRLTEEAIRRIGARGDRVLVKF